MNYAMAALEAFRAIARNPDATCTVLSHLSSVLVGAALVLDPDSQERKILEELRREVDARVAEMCHHID